MKHWNVLKKDKGFTLTEILVVAVIFGVLSAVAVPNLLGLIYNARVTDGVATIEGALKEAKAQAIRNSQTCVIDVVTNASGNYVVQPSTRAGLPANNSQCLLQTRELPEGVVVNINPAAMITFSGKGNADYIDLDNPAATPTNRTYTVSHNNISTSKCVYIEGLFGDVKTGIVQGGNCNTNL